MKLAVSAVILASASAVEHGLPLERLDGETQRVHHCQLSDVGKLAHE